MCNGWLRLDFRYAPFATEFVSRCNMSRRAKNGHRPERLGVHQIDITKKIHLADVDAIVAEDGIAIAMWKKVFGIVICSR